jgi:transcriptional regulator with XRE-family HTH domain
MSQIFDKALKSVSLDVKRFVENSIDIVDHIYFLMNEKGITQRNLASLLGKKESEISKLLSGTHNLTLRTISKIEAILGEKIIITPTKAKKSYSSTKFVEVKKWARLNQSKEIKSQVEETLIIPGNYSVFKGGIKSA